MSHHLFPLPTRVQPHGQAIYELVRPLYVSPLTLACSPPRNRKAKTKRFASNATLRPRARAIAHGSKLLGAVPKVEVG